MSDLDRIAARRRFTEERERLQVLAHERTRDVLAAIATPFTRAQLLDAVLDGLLRDGLVGSGVSAWVGRAGVIQALDEAVNDGTVHYFKHSAGPVREYVRNPQPPAPEREPNTLTNELLQNGYTPQ